ncbi:MAG: SDR family NAD(P)-dependent oxidoreductase [Fuerstiella sp.]
MFDDELNGEVPVAGSRLNPSRTAIITGAAGGLGREYSRILAHKGWNLAVVDIDPSGLDETCDIVRAAGGQAEPHQLDVTDAERWQTLLATLRQEWPKLDLLINSAGVSYSGAFETMDLSDWRRVLSVNLDGTMLGCHTMVPWLIENPDSGQIINTASFAAFAQSPYMAAYNVSKSAVVALSESLYTELTPRVYVTVVCPWFFRSGLLEKGRADVEWLARLADHLVEISPITAADVAQDAIRAMEKRKLHALVTRRAWRMWRIKRCAPKAFLGLVRRQFAGLRKKFEDQSVAGKPTAPRQSEN